MASEILQPFLGALQASLTVLLDVFYGVLAAQFGLLDEKSANSISQAAIKMFLPALMFTRIGSQVRIESAMRYIPIIVWAILYHVAAIGATLFISRMFKLPAWTTPAISFNNAISMPLLLLRSLEVTGVLKPLTGDGESPADAVDRAESYFLVFAMVANGIVFAVGDNLLGKKDKDQDDQEGGPGQEDEDPTENTSLLPDVAVRNRQNLQVKAQNRINEYNDKLPSWAQKAFHYAYKFCNGPLLGAVLGFVVGLVPWLHKVFFNETQDGGYFNAWLTSSLKNIGDLFVVLQVVIVGVQLATSLRKLKQGEESGPVPWVPMVFILAARYLIWPAIGIATIWGFAAKTNVFGNDRMLWFTMMVMPSGPPAMKLLALADAGGIDQKEVMSISKLLTIAHIAAPLSSIAVVGALKAVQKVGGSS
ncbi:hypothetical protein A1O1_02008 [Capronia coronata CBS 617.96]|uniref:Auxin efflux carrier n=1 Tax=Capronia coronata CBS 617.96 TaxID=1182541 RepID=W9YWG1_9EURO|nr:uncharacterized protein A1O1_02008 [Capronia coronata CBS 617.96]EXJ93616.1 hypothetical protein A1O1_02008 [Capronia coronata CBS 617.96]